MIVVAVLLLASIEMFWRGRGAIPDRVDDTRRWSFYRDRVDSMKDQNSTVLIGASRIQLGWSLAAFRSEFPRIPIVQLAIDGTHPVAVLRDLSETTDFRGVVIVALTAGAILPATREEAQGHVEFHRQSWKPNVKANFLIEDIFQEFFVTRQSQYGLSATVTGVLTGDLRRGGNYLATTRERERSADYRRTDIAAHRAERIRRLKSQQAAFRQPSPAVWQASMKELDRIVRPMVERGARVVFVRFPTSHEHWEIDRQMFPRDGYWDDMAKNIAGTWIHFSDVPALGSFELPDTSHIDKRDKAAFTKAILAELRRAGVY